MTTRRRLVLGALVALAPAPLLAQGGAPRNCQLQFRGSETRTNLVKLPSGRYNAFQGGGVTYGCEGQGNELRADSAEYYGEPGMLYMIGNVHYTESRVKVDANRMTYFQADDRLLAEGNVYAVLQSGTTMRGPRAEYWRAVPARPRQRMYANQRPRMQLVERDSAGRPQEPINVVADNINLDGDSLVYAGGRVEITRPDLDARGDSAFLDGGREFARLMRNPSIESKGERAFTLVGETIDLYSRSRRLERVVSKRQGVATSQDMRLASDTIDLRVVDNKLERAYAWGRSRARVTSPERDIVADSLDVLMPGQRLREVRALGGAYAESAVDTTQFFSEERDWLRGDTVIARFDSLAAADTSGKPNPRDIVAAGNASSFYQIASKQGLRGPPAVNYVRGKAITVAFGEKQVRTVTVLEQATGVYLEPTADSLKAAPVRGDSAAARVPGRTPANVPGTGNPRPTTPPAATPRGVPSPKKPISSSTATPRP